MPRLDKAGPMNTSGYGSWASIPLRASKSRVISTTIVPRKKVLRGILLLFYPARTSSPTLNIADLTAYAGNLSPSFSRSLCLSKASPNRNLTQFEERSEKIVADSRRSTCRAGQIRRGRTAAATVKIGMWGFLDRQCSM